MGSRPALRVRLLWIAFKVHLDAPPVLEPADAGPSSPGQSLLLLEHWACCKACGVFFEVRGGGAKQIDVLL